MNCHLTMAKEDTENVDDVTICVKRIREAHVISHENASYENAY